MKLIVLKRKTLCLIVAAIVLFATIVSFATVHANTMPKFEYTIVIDAGHGGVDGGASGDSGVTESRLNLDYALTLKEMCEDFGFGVVMTRSDMEGLYSPNAPNKKRSEMEKRKQIIDESDADVVVSIHMNSFPLSSTRGTQIFYGKGNESGKVLAESILNSVVRDIEYARDFCTIGDYYILNCNQKAGVLIECGFLSNPEEEKLLLQKEYREKLCYSILVGIVEYFQM